MWSFPPLALDPRNTDLDLTSSLNHRRYYLPEKDCPPLHFTVACVHYTILPIDANGHRLFSAVYISSSPNFSIDTERPPHSLCSPLSLVLIPHKWAGVLLPCLGPGWKRQLDGHDDSRRWSGGAYVSESLNLGDLRPWSPWSARF